MRPRDWFGVLVLGACLAAAHFLVRPETAETRGREDAVLSPSGESVAPLSESVEFRDAEAAARAVRDTTESLVPAAIATSDALPATHEPPEPIRTPPAGDTAPICDYTLEIHQMLQSLAPPCPGDVNEDDMVDFVDLTTALANFGKANNPEYADGDLDADDDIDEEDLAIIVNNLGISCPL